MTMQNMTRTLLLKKMDIRVLEIQLQKLPNWSCSRCLLWNPTVYCFK